MLKAVAVMIAIVLSLSLTAVERSISQQAKLLVGCVMKNGPFWRGEADGTGTAGVEPGWVAPLTSGYINRTYPVQATLVPGWHHGSLWGAALEYRFRFMLPSSNPSCRRPGPRQRRNT